MSEIRDIAQQAAQAAKRIGQLSGEQKRALLDGMSKALLAQEREIIEANQKDVLAAKEAGLSEAMVDRLTLDNKRIQDMADALIQVSEQPELIGVLSQPETQASGIQVSKMRVPLGVIAMIYESRPNVTAEAAALCIKSGNAVVLRGGKEARHSNHAIAGALHLALEEFGLAKQSVSVITNPDRSLMNELLKQDAYIDLVIPRGGEGLIRYVTENSSIPVIQHYKGVCHLYVDGKADINKALAILENGKTQRPGVCNALETLLVDKAIAAEFLPQVAAMLAGHKVSIHADHACIHHFPDAKLATEEDFAAEYLALEIAVAEVDGLEGALAHIETYGSQHTEVIVTEDQQAATTFIRRADASVVMHNASSRFSDGGQLGLGAEIGIATTKLHAYGPMGAESLTTQKFVVTGRGEVRS